MCTVLLPTVVNPIAVNKYININIYIYILLETLLKFPSYVLLETLLEFPSYALQETLLEFPSYLLLEMECPGCILLETLLECQSFTSNVFTMALQKKKKELRLLNYVAPDIEVTL